MLQKDVAKVLGITQKMYSRYETGENELPIRHLITLAKHYHVPTDYILGMFYEKNQIPIQELPRDELFLLLRENFRSHLVKQGKFLIDE